MFHIRAESFTVAENIMGSSPRIQVLEMSLPDTGIWVNCSNSPSKIEIITPITKAPVKNHFFNGGKSVL